jgi:ketosteroid isomerase-like protein
MTTESVLQHHLQCFGSGDLNGIISGYTESSVLFTPNGVLRGTQEIRKHFAAMFAEFAQPGVSFDMLRRDVSGENAYLVWKARTAANDYELGTDTFVIRDDKIQVHSLAWKSVPHRR